MGILPPHARHFTTLMDQMMVRADMIPPLTTVRQPAMEMGHAAAHTTLTPFDTELIIRESVARHL